MFGQQTGATSNKQICSYYLKGTCKYGAKCWYYHPPSQGGTAVFGSTGGNVFSNKSGTQQESKEFMDFVKQVSGEMTQWERSGQWLTSSFSPLKAHPLLSSFTDTSPEEFRMEAYQALKNNTNATYQARWAETQQHFRQLREALKMSTQEAVLALREVFYNKSSLEQQQQQVMKQPTGLFGKTSSSTVFGGAPSVSGGAGLLGAKPQTSLFGSSTSSVFGGGTQSSSATGSSTSSVFGGGTQSSSSSIFGGSNTNKSVFGGQPTLGTQNTSAFGTQSSGLFRSSGGSVFGTQSSTGTPSVFGSSSQPQASSSSLFGASGSNTQQPTAAPNTALGTQGSIFGQQQQTQQHGGLFGSQQQQPQQQTGLFGNQQQQPQQQQTGLFGAQPQQQTGLFGNQQQSQQQPGLFGSQPQQQTQQTQQPGSAFAMTNVFSGSQSTTQPQTSTASIFGGVFAGASSGQGAGKGLFGASATPGGFTKPGLFGNSEANPNPGLFGKPPDPSPAPGLFGQGSPASSAPIASQGDTHNYTPLDQLLPEDRAQFEAEVFTFVPLCPPPLEMCR